jgi:hypothetical protein
MVIERADDAAKVSGAVQARRHRPLSWLGEPGAVTFSMMPRHRPRESHMRQLCEFGAITVAATGL